MWTKSDQFRLHHEQTGFYLHSHQHRYDIQVGVVCLELGWWGGFSFVCGLVLHGLSPLCLCFSVFSSPSLSLSLCVYVVCICFSLQAISVGIFSFLPFTSSSSLSSSVYVAVSSSMAPAISVSVSLPRFVLLHTLTPIPLCLCEQIIQGQQEVTGFQQANNDNLWTVAEGVFLPVRKPDEL